MAEPTEMVGVRYVGRMKRRFDNVNNNPKVVWNGPGAVQRVPRAQALRLFKHKDAFVPEDADWQMPKDTPTDSECVTVGRMVLDGAWDELLEKFPEAYAAMRAQFSGQPAARAPARPPTRPMDVRAA